MKLSLPNETATQHLGALLAANLKAPLLISLSGEIGAGKTTLIRSLLHALNVKESVKSPTFSIVESYNLPSLSCSFHHFDLYRIVEIDELEYIGFRDYFTAHSICCVEWPERAKGAMSEPDLQINLTWDGIGRRASLDAYTSKGRLLIKALSQNPHKL